MSNLNLPLCQRVQNNPPTHPKHKGQGSNTIQHVSLVTQKLLINEGKERQLELAEKMNVCIISIADSTYPSLLRKIPNPPSYLYVKGTIPEGKICIACVGTRKPTHWGKTVTERITKMLINKDFTIVSGLAMGIDTIAHTTALNEQGQTIAVLPFSLDSVYPKKHQAIAEKILETGGALISEQPFYTTQPKPHMFVQRNRIISGLCQATIVFQCEERGGTQHTARFCQEQERLLYVVKPTGNYIKEEQNQGNNALLTLPNVVPIQSREDYSKLLQILTI